MKFALLGDDPAVLPLVRAIAAHPDHRLTHGSQLGGLQPEVMPLVPSLRVCPEWDELLLADALDAVVLAGHSGSVLEGGRQLAGNGKPLLIVPDVRQGLDWIYQLTLIRDDTRVLLAPLIPTRVQPALRRAHELLEAGALGTVLHLQFERERPPDAKAAGPPLLTRDDVDRELLLDVDLLRQLSGDYDQVTAVYSGTVGPQLSLATVTLAGRNLPEATWSLRAESARRWSLKLAGVKGQLELRADETDPEPVLLLNGDRQVPSLEKSAGAGDELLAWIKRTLAGEHTRPTWTDLTRAFELVNATHRSIARRRTVDLHFESTSERSQFKTQMAALGCGVLLFTMFAMIAVLLAGAVFDIGDQAMRIARVLVFLPLFLYLLLQGLLSITRPSLSGDGEQQPE